MKTYLGDSLFADFNGWLIRLYTENGRGKPENMIFLEARVLDNLIKYGKQVFKQPADV